MLHRRALSLLTVAAALTCAGLARADAPSERLSGKDAAKEAASADDDDDILGDTPASNSSAAAKKMADPKASSADSKRAAQEAEDEKDTTGDDDALTEGAKDVTGRGAVDAKTPTTEAPLGVDVTNEETIYVVEAKPHLVRGRFELAPQIVTSLGEQFVAHSGVFLSALYNIRENLAVEVIGGAFFWWDSGAYPNGRLGGRPADMTLEIRKEGLQPAERADLYTYTWLAAADLQFSPLYGKVNFHDVLLGQFNAYLSVGLGVGGLQLESDKPDELEKIPGAFGGNTPMQALASFGGGIRLYFNDRIGLRFEVRDYVAPLAVYKSDVPSLAASSSDVLNTVLAQLGVSFIF
jgi:outer membrane beta-barrel protein